MASDVDGSSFASDSLATAGMFAPSGEPEQPPGLAVTWLPAATHTASAHVVGMSIQRSVPGPTVRPSRLAIRSRARDSARVGVRAATTAGRPPEEHATV